MSNLSPERRQLAEAISVWHETASTVSAIEHALDYDGAAWLAIREARRRVEEAEGALDAAKAGRVSVLEATAAGREATAPPLTMREARMALEEAKDEVEASELAKEAMTERLGHANMAHGLADHRVREAAHDVIRAETEPRSGEIFLAYQAAVRTMLDLQATVEFLMLQKCIMKPAGIQDVRVDTQRWS